MSKQHIHIGVEDASRGFDRFVEAWHKAEMGEIEQAEIHLNFEDFELRVNSDRDYKNVHADAGALESVDLIQRTDEGLLAAPWDVIDAHVRLVA